MSAREDVRTLAVAELTIENVGGRMVLRDQWIDGEHDDGRRFEVTRSLSSPELVVTVTDAGGKRRSYIANTRPLIDSILDVDADLRDGERREWRVYNDAG